MTEEKTQEQEAFEEDVKAYAEESGKTVEEITAAYCHCCGQKFKRTFFDEMFGQSAVCQCALSKHCYRCVHCHIHCECEEGPTPSAKFWLIEKHGKTDRRNIPDMLMDKGTIEDVIDYVMGYIDLVRSEQYNEDKVAKFETSAFKVLLEWVYGKDIFKEISRLVDA